MLGSQEVEAFSDLFFTSVSVHGKVQLKGMLDTGSMACTLSEHAEQRLLEAGALPQHYQPPTELVLVGCGGKKTSTKCFYDLEMQIYGIDVKVPTLVVPGQRDDLILGSNVIKHLLHEMKGTDEYWKLVNNMDGQTHSPEGEQFLQMMTSVTRWKGQQVDGKIGTVKLTQAVTLSPKTEHLVWGKLPKNVALSPGSTVIVEPTRSKVMPRNILVGRVITPMWGDGWVPLKVVNCSDKHLTLRRNMKLADVSTCLAVEDATIFQGLHEVRKTPMEQKQDDNGCQNLKQRLSDLGLVDIVIDGCQVTDQWKEKLVNNITKYEEIFSRHNLDCGEARDYVQRIHLVDDRPFRLPYRRVPPAHYLKLRKVLTDMEEVGLIRKSVSEYASPLVMVWKKDGSLRLCTDFRWMNARTVKDAHPLPHKANCLVAVNFSAPWT
ncbi:unnamed protein product [Oncorhynchus mykiss]|uniref:Peptidase A2 domain-containing protein n=1 Tax=Oncorhynchus mykiss TaxID=8022 RepID=A0A060YUE8_ONCMY|nr:unnamed protein product [Oncorhynchus mykiss]